MELKFREPRINTITCDGSIGVRQINIYRLAKMMKLNQNIVYIKYYDSFKTEVDTTNKYLYSRSNFKYPNPWHNPDADTSMIITTPLETIVDGTKFTHENGVVTVLYEIGIVKAKKTKKDFDNSFSFNMYFDSNINCKVYTNGFIHMTGCKSRERIDQVFAYLNDMFNTFYDQQERKEFRVDDDYSVVKVTLNRFGIDTDRDTMCLRDIQDVTKRDAIRDFLNTTILRIKNRKCMIFSSKPCIVFKNISLIMVDIAIIDAHINLLELWKLLQKNQDSSVFQNYENKRNKTMCLKIFSPSGYVISYNIFRSGKINITNIKTMDDIGVAVDLLRRVIEPHFDKIQFKNSSLDLVELIRSGGAMVQKSEEWLKMRARYVTASEAYKVIMRVPPPFLSVWKSMRKDYIDAKVRYIRTGEKDFNGNDATRLGEVFEPIARDIFKLVYSSHNNQCVIEVYEVGLIIREPVGASPDGIVVKFSANTPKPVTLEKLEEYAISDQEIINENKKDTNHILDVCLLEIKCPKNFHKLEHGLKIDKEHYYWQVQQQLYVLRMRYAVFFQCQIVEISPSEYEPNRGNAMYGHVYVTRAENGDIKPAETIYGAPYDRNRSGLMCWRLNDFDLEEIDYDEHGYTQHLPRLKRTKEKIARRADAEVDDQADPDPTYEKYASMV